VTAPTGPSPAARLRAVPGGLPAAPLVIPTPPAQVPAQALGRDIRAIVDELDDQIVRAVLCRAELARQEQSERRRAGLPASELAWENAMLARYADRLGRKGADIARAVLSLSQLSQLAP